MNIRSHFPFLLALVSQKVFVTEYCSYSLFRGTLVKLSISAALGECSEIVTSSSNSPLYLTSWLLECPLHLVTQTSFRYKSLIMCPILTCHLLPIILICIFFFFFLQRSLTGKTTHRKRAMHGAWPSSTWRQPKGNFWRNAYRSWRGSWAPREVMRLSVKSGTQRLNLLMRWRGVWKMAEADSVTLYKSARRWSVKTRGSSGDMTLLYLGVPQAQQFIMRGELNFCTGQNVKCFPDNKQAVLNKIQFNSNKCGVVALFVHFTWQSLNTTIQTSSMWSKTSSKSGSRSTFKWTLLSNVYSVFEIWTSHKPQTRPQRKSVS